MHPIRAPYDGGVDLQLETLASIAAVISVPVSIWALITAKRAPLQERTRNHRDIVRNALLEAQRTVEPLDLTLRTGDPLPDCPNELKTARRAIDNYGKRLPEYRSQILMLDLSLGELQHNWNDAERDERFADEIQQHAYDTEQRAQDKSLTADHQEHYQMQLAETRKRVERAKRAATASRNALQTAVTEMREKTGKYLIKWDIEDRGPV